MSLHFHRKGKNTCLCFPIAVSHLLLPLKLLKYAFQTYCLNFYWNYSLLIWAATSPIHYGMGIQFVRIFFVPVLSSKNLPSFSSFPFLSFSTLLVPKEAQDSSVTPAFVLELISVLLCLVLVLQLLSCSYLQLLILRSHNLLKAWQFLSFSSLFHSSPGLSMHSLYSKASCFP